MPTLRFEIDGHWTVQDFTDYLGSLNHIYSVLAVAKIEYDSAIQWAKESLESSPRIFVDRERLPSPGINVLGLQRLYRVGTLPLLRNYNLTHAFSILEEHERLRIRRIEYSSPGFSDLTGLGAIIGHVKDIVIKIIDTHTGREERKLKNDILEEERRAAALRNVREQISILKEIGYSESEIREIIASCDSPVAKLESLSHRGLLVGLSEVADD